MKNHHISEAGVSFEIQFGLFIKIWAGEHIIYIWQQTIALKHSILKQLLFPSRITQSLRIHWLQFTHSLGAPYAFTGYTLRIHWVRFTHSLGTLYAFTGYIINVYWVH